MLKKYLFDTIRKIKNGDQTRAKSLIFHAQLAHGPLVNKG